MNSPLIIIWWLSIIKKPMADRLWKGILQRNDDSSMQLSMSVIDVGYWLILLIFAVIN